MLGIFLLTLFVVIAILLFDPDEERQRLNKIARIYDELEYRGDDDEPQRLEGEIEGRHFVLYSGSPSKEDDSIAYTHAFRLPNRVSDRLVARQKQDASDIVSKPHDSDASETPAFGEMFDVEQEAGRNGMAYLEDPTIRVMLEELITDFDHVDIVDGTVRCERHGSIEDADSITDDLSRATVTAEYLPENPEDIRTDESSTSDSPPERW
jgi:hypothetical protein